VATMNINVDAGIIFGLACKYSKDFLFCPMLRCRCSMLRCRFVRDTGFEANFEGRASLLFNLIQLRRGIEFESLELKDSLVLSA
jgi:hypothetical protein